MQQALSGLRVLELCSGTAGAYCGKLLSDLGAEVVKLEPHEGDPARHSGPFAPGRESAETSGRFLYLSTGKRSVVFDSAAGDAAAHIARRIAEADVLVEDLAAGERERLIGEPAAAVMRRLVWCSLTPFGLSGPYAGFKARHINVFHAGGEGKLLPSGEGFLRFPQRAPLQLGSDAGDFDAGANAAIAILAAWRSGRGERIDVSLQESQLTLNRTRLSRFNNDGIEMRRSGPPYAGAGMFACADGWIQLLGTQDEHWRRFGESEPEFADPRFATADGRRASSDELRARLSAWCAARAKRDAVATLAPLGFAVGEFASAGEVVRSAQLAHRGFFQSVDHADAGRVKLPGAPYQLSATPVVLKSAPRLGAHRGFAPRDAQREVGRAPLPEPSAAPLAGIRILDFTWAAAGPYATLLLGLLGAEVIKVESSRRPDPARRGFLADYGGVDRSPNFAELNLGKRSLRIDLTQPRGLELVRRLLPLCDMVVDNFRPGVMRRFGLDSVALLAQYPRMIVGSSSGNGASGPQAMTAGLASIFSAAGGLSEQTGYADGPPTEVGESTDYRSGNAFAVALLAALIARDRSGAGQFIDLSSTEVVAAHAPDALLAELLGAKVHGRLGNRHPSLAPHGLYRCAGDDEWLSLAVESETEWRALCELLERPQWAAQFGSAAARKANEDAIDAALAEWSGSRDVHDAFLLLQQNGIAAAPSFSNRRLAGDAHLAARKLFVDVEHPVIGRHRVMRAPWLFAATSCAYRPGPLLGQDNDYVLGELLGLSAAERTALAEVLC